MGKILVCNPPFVSHYCRGQRWPARTRGRIMRPPDYLAYCSSVLEQDGWEVDLYDFPAEGWSTDDLRSIIAEMRPDIVVIDSSTPSIYSDIKCAKICKEASGCVVIMVGSHATALPEEVLRTSGNSVDIIARGEYEYTVRDIARSISGSGGDLSSVEGASYLRNGNYVSTRDREFIADLDELPFPAWHHLDIRKYFDGIKLFPFMDIIGSRGCPHSCIFCMYPQVMHGRAIRRRSPESVLAEIEHDLNRWPEIKRGEIFFEDDNFAADREYTHRLCDEISSAGYGITWSANCRPNGIEEETLVKMRKAGCRMLVVGYESGSRKMLDEMKKNLTIDQSIEFTRAAKKAGLSIHGCFMVGMPGETMQTIEETFRMIHRLPIDTVQISAAVPFPGTEFYKLCKEHNLLYPDQWDEWLGEGEHTDVVKIQDMPKGYIHQRIDSELRRFYFRPKYVIRNMLNVRSFGDFYRKARGALHLLSYFLKRRAA